MQMHPFDELMLKINLNKKQNQLDGNCHDLQPTQSESPVQQEPSMFHDYMKVLKDKVLGSASQDKKPRKYAALGVRG
jgi:hypothetical protein